MLPFLQFLHDETLGSCRIFAEAVEKQAKDCPLACRWRLQSALVRCTIRASKYDLKNLPPLRRKVVLLDFQPSHADSYSDYVDLVRSNLLLADWFDPDHTESLLSPDNSQKAAQFLDNLRQSCNVSGNIKLQVTPTDLHSCLEFIAGATAHPPPLPFHLPGGLPPFFPADHPLARVESGLRFGGPCDCCRQPVRLLIATPCACILCVHCTAQNRTHCPQCRHPYTMQSVNDPARRRDAQGGLNPNPKWAVPKELIEWQPAYVQLGATGAAEGYWQEDWKHTESTKISYLIKRLREQGVLPPVHRRMMLGGDGDGSGSGTISSSGSGKEKQGGAIELMLDEHNNVIQWPPPLPPPPSNGIALHPKKAIIFTQFAIHARLIINRLEEAVPSACFARYHKNMSQQEKIAAIRRFRRDPACTVLLLDESGALGLDLSFVQHVFLMEPVPNTSLEEQVVSRAHRMGAREEVMVEVLVMRGTLEEEIMRRCVGAGTTSGSTRTTNVGEYQEMHWYDDKGEQGTAVGRVCVPGGEGGGGVTENKRLAAVQRGQQNAYLKSLRPVRSTVSPQYPLIN